MPSDRLWWLLLVKYLSLPPVDTTVNTFIPPAVSNVAQVCELKEQSSKSVMFLLMNRNMPDPPRLVLWPSFGFLLYNQ